MLLLVPYNHSDNLETPKAKTEEKSTLQMTHEEDLISGLQCQSINQESLQMKPQNCNEDFYILKYIKFCHAIRFDEDTEHIARKLV